MVELFNEAERKNKTLATWTKERVEQLSRVTVQWDNYKTLMDNHEQIVAKQVSWLIPPVAVLQPTVYDC